MSKPKVEFRFNGEIRFTCPGCGDLHVIPTNPGDGPTWTFNGDVLRPTIRPSISVRSGHYVDCGPAGTCWCHDPDAPFECYVCHSFVTDGNIHFLEDCSHALRGRTVELPELR